MTKSSKSSRFLSLLLLGGITAGCSAKEPTASSTTLSVSTTAETTETTIPASVVIPPTEDGTEVSPEVAAALSELTGLEEDVAGSTVTPPTEAGTEVSPEVAAALSELTGLEEDAAGSTVTPPDPTVETTMSVPLSVPPLKDGEARLTMNQATRLAFITKRLWDGGGAKLSITQEFGESTVSMNGEVNFKGKGCRLDVVLDTPGVEPDKQVVWCTPTHTLVQAGPETEFLAKAGLPDVKWLARTVDLENGPVLDRLLSVVLILGTEQGENPLLMRQGDSAFVSESLDAGTETYRYGSSLWTVNTTTGDLVTVRLGLDGGENPATITVIEKREVDLTFPLSNEVITMEQLAKLRELDAANNATAPTTSKK